MKKHLLLFVLVVGTFSVAQQQPASANDNDRDRERAVPVQEAENRDFGWIGLLGLAGLAGLRRRKHVEHRDARYDNARERNEVRRAG